MLPGEGVAGGQRTGKSECAELPCCLAQPPPPKKSSLPSQKPEGRAQRRLAGSSREASQSRPKAAPSPFPEAVRRLSWGGWGGGKRVFPGLKDGPL